MKRTIVAAHLLRVEHVLALTRRRSRRVAGQPAVLIIPRGGVTLAPHLVVLDDPRPSPGRGEPEVSAAPPACPAETRATSPALRRIAEPVVVEVLTCGGGPVHGVSASRLDRVLDRHPGISAAVGRAHDGHLLRLRDGLTVTVTEPTVPHTASATWPATYASAVHCWMSAGLPAHALEEAVVAAGYYHAATGGCSADDRFAVAGCTNVRIRRTHHRRRRSAPDRGGRDA